MLFAPEAAADAVDAEALTPLTSILFAPDAAGNDGLPDFGLPLPGRNSSLGKSSLEPRLPTRSLGDLPPRWSLLNLCPRGEGWRERFGGPERSKLGDLRPAIGERSLLCSLPRGFSIGDRSRFCSFALSSLYLFLLNGDLSRVF